MDCTVFIDLVLLFFKDISLASLRMTPDVNQEVVHGQKSLEEMKDMILHDAPSDQDLQEMCWSNAYHHCKQGVHKYLDKYLYLLHTYHSTAWNSSDGFFNVLITAAEHGKVAITRPLAAQYCPGCLDFVSGEWRAWGSLTQFHAAITHNHYNYLEFMLEYGADVNAASTQTWRIESVIVAAINHTNTEQSESSHRYKQQCLQ